MIVFHRERIVNCATKNRLPSMHGDKAWVEAGGLISYGPDILDSFRRAATYVDKILKGTKPADLPVEQPKKFELVIISRRQADWPDDSAQRPGERGQGDQMIVESKIEKTCPEHDTEGAKILRGNA